MYEFFFEGLGDVVAKRGMMGRGWNAGGLEEEEKDDDGEEEGKEDEGEVEPGLVW